MTVPEVSRGGRRARLLILLGGLLSGCDVGAPPHRLPPPATPLAEAPAGPTSPGEPTEARGSNEPAAPGESVATPVPGDTADAPGPKSEARPQVLPMAPRALPPPTARAEQLQALAERLEAPGAPMEDPCLLPREGGCERTALSPFFASLDALASGLSPSPVVLEAFGNSLIAGDRIVNILREDLGASFGAAGRGVLLVDRMAPYGGRERSAAVSTGWQPRTLGELRAPPHAFGMTGVYHVATESRARGRFRLEGEPRGTLWWLDVPKGGRLTVSSGGQVLASTEPSGSGQGQATRFDIPAGAKWLDVTAEGKGAIVQGVVLQHERPGIVLDMLGVPSADASLFGRFGEELLKAQLAERSPRLMLFFLGGNEAKRLEWKRTDPETMRRDLTALLRRVRAAAPESACLVVGPIDAVQDAHVKGKPLSQRPYLEAVISAEREVATAEGCAFFNLFAAMGGEGSLVRFHKAGFVHDDLVHPRGKGLDLLGQLVTDALLRAWAPGGSAVPALTSEREPPVPPASPAQASETVP